MTPKQWTAPCALSFRRARRRTYERDTVRSREADVFDTLRRAVDLDDEQAEADLAEVLSNCTPEELDELSTLAEMDGDE